MAVGHILQEPGKWKMLHRMLLIMKNFDFFHPPDGLISKCSGPYHTYRLHGKCPKHCVALEDDITELYFDSLTSFQVFNPLK